MISEINLSLEPETRGHACFFGDGKVTIYLPTLTSLLNIPREFFPFNTVEELLSELTFHELLHKVTQVGEDDMVDRWHMLECRLVSRRKKCDCPINCFFRDCLGST